MEIGASLCGARLCKSRVVERRRKQHPDLLSKQNTWAISEPLALLGQWQALRNPTMLATVTVRWEEEIDIEWDAELILSVHGSMLSRHVLGLTKTTKRYWITAGNATR